MGRVSQAQAEENRRRVVETASRLFREHGTHVSVADLMKASGLTHGGFYKQFASKEALVNEATAHAFNEFTRLQQDKVEQSGTRGPAQRALIDSYLSVEHRDNPAEGCPVAALAIDMAREPEDREASRIFTEGWVRSPRSSPLMTRTASPGCAPCSARSSWPGRPRVPRSPRTSSPPRTEH